MAENTVINTGTGGDTIATDELTTLNGAASTLVKVQRMKVGFGSDNILRDVDTANPLPIGGGLVSTVNSTATALLANGVFTGTSEDVSQYACVNVFVFASHASATDGLSMQFSTDSTNFDNADVYTIPATTGKTFSIQVVARFFRVVYTNGATAQTALRLQTIHHSVMQLGSSIRPQDGRGNDNDMQEELAHGMVYNGTSWDRARGDITNGADVDVTRLPALATGTATVGAVTLESNSMNAGGTVVTPLFAVISASTTGISTLVALVAAKRIRVLAVSLVASAAVNAKFQSSVTPTDISGLYYLAANGGFILPFNQAGWFQTVAGEALTINLSAAIAVGGSITYITV